MFVTLGALDAPIVTLCEGAFDALALAACGFPALAMVGCNMPGWLPGVLAFKRVLVASDADDAGEKAACEWTAALQSFGARCERLKPYQAKDFSEMLQRDGRDPTAAYLQASLNGILAFQWRG